MEVLPLTGNLGAQISGLDLGHELPDTEIRNIRDALDRHGVVFFRGQSELGPDGYTAFARRFGQLTTSPNSIMPRLADAQEIAIVRKAPNQPKNIGDIWHTDQSYQLRPARATFLLGRSIPAAGGDTLFTSMAAAFDALSAGLQSTLLGLRAVHSNRDIASTLAIPEVVHPVVIRHPGSGRRVLYVNPAYTIRFEGWTEAESQPLLRLLFAHAQRPEFQCRFKWQVGSLAIWDNLQTWHYAVNDYPGGDERIMHRVLLVGEPLEAAAH